MNYTLYFTSADGPETDSPWSVYVEEYVSPDSDEPIEGNTRHVGSFPNQDHAWQLAKDLQAASDERYANRKVEFHDFEFKVIINAETVQQARIVMAERLAYDEEYGFHYTVSWV